MLADKTIGIKLNILIFYINGNVEKISFTTARPVNAQ